VEYLQHYDGTPAGARPLDDTVFVSYKQPCVWENNFP
jgi:hypothetical protein